MRSAVVAGLPLAFFVSVVQSQALECDEWDTSLDFFESATVADVDRCLGEGRAVNEPRDISPWWSSTWTNTWTPLHEAAALINHPKIDAILR